MYITKKNGNVVLYEPEKLIKSILKANSQAEEEEISRQTASNIANKVFDELTREMEIITTQDVRKGVYAKLCEMGLPSTAKQYMAFTKKDKK